MHLKLYLCPAAKLHNPVIGFCKLLVDNHNLFNILLTCSDFIYKYTWTFIFEAWNNVLADPYGRRRSLARANVIQICSAELLPIPRLNIVILGILANALFLYCVRK
jgi:hypothetical protein